jgi:hypothetical protein
MAPTAKLDLYRQHKAEYVTPSKPQFVDVGPARYLAIQGQGEPGGALFTASLSALYGIAFTIKMARKKAGRDYKVAGLEGLWWTDDPTKPMPDLPPSAWRSGGTRSAPCAAPERWKLLIRTPDFITQADLAQARKALLAKGKSPLAAQVKLETIREGRCVQALHVGPYDKEHQTIGAMDAFADASGLAFHGLHHEIYLSDPRRVPPAKLRTILRHPVRPLPKKDQPALRSGSTAMRGLSLLILNARGVNLRTGRCVCIPGDPANAARRATASAVDTSACQCYGLPIAERSES